MFLKTLQMINADNFIIIEPTVPFGGGGGVLLCFVFVLCVFLQMINVKKMIEILYLPHKMHQNLINTIPRMLMQTVAVAGVDYQRAALRLLQ